MKLRASKGAVAVSRYGQHHDVKEIKYNGVVIWPVYSLELSADSITIPASGGGSTISVYGVARNENGDLISRTQLTYPEVTITKTGAAAIQNNVFTFYAESRGTTVGYALNATYTITWKGYSIELPVTQEANYKRTTEQKNYFTLKDAYSSQTVTLLAGTSYEVSTAAHRYTVGCYYVADYLYSSGATEQETANGTVKSKSGSSGWSYMNGVLSCSANTGTTSRTAILTAYFPDSAHRGTLNVAQVKPTVIIYDVAYTSYTMHQSGGKKVFNFGITYNSNLTGKAVTFWAIKVNNGVETQIASLSATLTGTSFTYAGNGFSGNDATATGDEYYITFTYDGQTFTSPALTNAYYLDNLRVAYSSGSIINAAGSNYAYVLADLMQGGTATESGVTCDITNISGEGLTITNGKLYGANKGTSISSEISVTVTRVTYGQYSAAASLSAKQQANAVTSTAHSYDYVMTGLASPFPSGAAAASAGEGGAITFSSCKQYDTPQYTYTSGATANGTRTEVGSVVPTYSKTASWLTLSGAYVTAAKQAKTGAARSAVVTLLYGSVQLGEVAIYQKATAKSYSLNVSSSAASVGAGGGSVTLTATGVTSYDNGDTSENTSLTTGWSCTNSGSLVSGKWSVSGRTATAGTLGTTTTTGANNGTFSISWNGVTKAVTVAQNQNTRTEGAATGTLTIDDTAYTSNASLQVTYAAHDYIVVGRVVRNFTYSSGATSTASAQPVISASGNGFSYDTTGLHITENTGSSARSGALTMSYNNAAIVTVSYTQAKYVPVYALAMTATYRMVRARLTFDVSVDPYSDSLRGKSVDFQPYRITGGTRTNIGTAQSVTMPSSGNTTSLSIATVSSLVLDSSYYVEASYGGTILATCEAYEEM